MKVITLQVECATEVRASCAEHLVRCANCAFNTKRDASGLSTSYFRAAQPSVFRYTEWAKEKQRAYIDKLRTAYLTLANLIRMENGLPDGLAQSEVFDRHIVLSEEHEAWPVFVVYNGLVALRNELVALLTVTSPEVVTDASDLKKGCGQTEVAAQLDNLLERAANTRVGSAFQKVAETFARNNSFSLLLDACEEPLRGGSGGSANRNTKSLASRRTRT